MLTSVFLMVNMAWDSFCLNCACPQRSPEQHLIPKITNLDIIVTNLWWNKKTTPLQRLFMPSHRLELWTLRFSVECSTN